MAILALVGSIGSYYRVQAAKSGERLSYREEGRVFAAVLRSCGLVLWICTLGYVFYPAGLHWAAMPIPTSLRWLAVALAILGAGLMAWTMHCLGKNLTDTVVTRANATLITHGPYRWVRHPFYGTAAILMTAVTLLTANGLIGLSCLVVFSLLAIRTPKEEQMLLARFGQEYRDYMSTTGRFLPKWPR